MCTYIHILHWINYLHTYLSETTQPPAIRLIWIIVRFCCYCICDYFCFTKVFALAVTIRLHKMSSAKIFSVAITLLFSFPYYYLWVFYRDGCWLTFYWLANWGPLSYMGITLLIIFCCIFNATFSSIRCSTRHALQPFQPPLLHSCNKSPLCF